jgi:hypothetical protein
MAGKFIRRDDPFIRPTREKHDGPAKRRESQRLLVAVSNPEFTDHGFK